MIPTGEATAMLPTGGKTKPITVIGTEKIRDTFDEICLRQAINSRLAPGVTDLILNPDGHCGYGAPIGCVMTSPTVKPRFATRQLRRSPMPWASPFARFNVPWPNCATHSGLQSNTQKAGAKRAKFRSLVATAFLP